MDMQRTPWFSSGTILLSGQAQHGCFILRCMMCKKDVGF